ncbi:hypothetical protein VB773_05190 [Haloarculaceae archaeon H-GB2-1]|nr:hypothetical protein [Haloarculaceae archaeon H-GB1-1]MEA5388973.1 hypothetical protein [Haloarculaceae archaeon H-GB11]MEA5407031.1 hypothetical protein [Haloarculaceae archaeon H-GB2-1]
MVRCWLVERDYWDEDLVTLVYATPDGERAHHRQLSSALLQKTSVTAAREIDDDDLNAVEDAETRERYAAEAERMARKYEPSDDV